MEEESAVNVAELRDKASKEAKLATVYLLQLIEQEGDQGAHLRNLREQVSRIQEELRAQKIALRFGYRNELEEFLRRLFLLSLLEIDYDASAEDIVCRLTDRGRSELQESPPERVRSLLVG